MQGMPALYVHIPFCLTKCDYCDFFSLPCTSSISDRYIDALLAEADYYSRFYSSKKGLTAWKTIYIGGGTPSLLSPRQLERLLIGLKQLFPKNNPLEISVEMNPETLGREHLSVMEGTGVTRLSLGIQSLNDRILQGVKRHCTAKKCRDTLDLVKSEWKMDLNLDAIAGLGDSSSKEFESSLNEMLNWEPEHVSLYTLTVEEGTPLAQRIESGEEWNQEEADRQWLTGRDILEEHGYEQYEVSNFAKPGHESIHNMAYWKQEDYIGIGAGATGSIYDFSGKNGFRYTNTRNIELYYKFWKGESIAEESIPRETEMLPLEVEEFEYLMMGLRTLTGINSIEYKKRFSKLRWYGDLGKRLGQENGLWNDWQKMNLAKTCGDSYALTREGLLFLNSFLTAL